MNNDLLTKSAEELSSMYGVSEGLEKLKECLLSYPQRPVKPILKPNHNSDDLIQYTISFNYYNEELKRFEEEKELWKERDILVRDKSIELVKYCAGLSDVPKKISRKTL